MVGMKRISKYLVLAPELIKLHIIQKAQDLNLDGMAREVALILGKQDTDEYGNNYVFENNYIKIKFDEPANNLWLFYENEVVLIRRVGELTKAILRKQWIDSLQQAYEVAKKIQESDKNTEETLKQKEINDNWQDHTGEITQEPKKENPHNVDQETFEKVINYCRDTIWTKPGGK